MKVSRQGILMPKVSQRKLSTAEQKELIGELCVAITQVDTLDSAIRFVVDLFSQQEIAMMAKRLKIAKLLLEGEKYEAIGARLKVGTATIARIRAWLDEGGSGFRLVYQKTKHKKNPLQEIFLDEPHWRAKYRGKQLYFWPSMLLEEISRSASKRQRNRLISILEDIPKKQKIHHDLISIFQGSSSKIRTKKHHNKRCRKTFIL